MILKILQTVFLYFLEKIKKLLFDRYLDYDMDPKDKKIAIVGGGFCGMCTISMLKEEGFDPICFEKTDRAGGTWCYRDESTIGVSSIMPTTIINHSKELGAISNCPPAKDSSNYMKHTELHKYLMAYAKKNDVLRHIQFNSEVEEVKRTSDHETTGRWVVTVKDTLTGETSSDTFDAVVICCGHLNIPKWGSYKDQEKFKGKIMHTHSLKGVGSFKNKNVVVIGMGCSGLDAAVEISSVAKQVYLSTRSGGHVFSRVGPNGYPLDYVLLRRYNTFLLNILPTNILSWLLENLLLDSNFNHRLYSVRPKYHLLSKDPIFNDHLASKLLSGSVVQKQEVERFTENGVIFEGESVETEADVIIMATGYTWRFPYLEKDLGKVEKMNFYKCIWLPHLKHPTLAFVGLLLPFGPGFPLGEMQCRYVSQVFAGKVKLPTEEEMLKDIERRCQKNEKRYGSNEKQSIRVDFTQYLDEIADIIGCKPNFIKYMLTDPKLFYKLIFGPSVSYQYRLEGPHAWEGAREAIMTCEERVHYPLIKKNENSVEHVFIKILKRFLKFLLPS